MNDQRTPFERAIDEASAFNPLSVLTYRPVERICDVCHELHFGHVTTCARCQRWAA